MRIEVMRTVGEAYLFAWQQRRDLALIAAPIAIVLGTARALLSYFRPFPDGGEAVLTPGFLLAGVIVAILSLVGWVLFVTAWHRRCLVSNYQSTVSQELRWQRRHSLFLGRTIILGLLTILVSMVLALPVSFLFAAWGSAGGTAAISLWMMVVFVVEARFMLVFPAASLDDLMAFGKSWTRSEGNALRIAAVLILTSVPISIAFAPVDWLLSSVLVTLGLLHSLAALFVASLVESFIGLVVTACGVAGLSFCFRDLGR